MGVKYAQLVAQGQFAPASLDVHNSKGRIYSYETVPLNTADLIDPVPASVYYDARERDCWGRQSHCQTITDDTYRPPLVLDYGMWLAMAQEHFPCERVLMVSPTDPPIALHPIDAALTEVSIPFAEATQATPGHGGVLSEPLAVQTGATAGVSSYQNLISKEGDNYSPIQEDGGGNLQEQGNNWRGNQQSNRSNSNVNSSKTTAFYYTSSAARFNANVLISWWIITAFLFLG